MKYLDSVDLKGKRVLIRVDFNVPLKNGVIQDDNRIVQSLPTIRLALEKGAAVVLCSHLGKPKGKVVPELSLAPVAAHLSDLLNRDVTMAPDCVGDEAAKFVADLAPGHVLMLENLRFHAGEEANDEAFAKALAAGVDVYVDDAFGTAHRAHASNVGVTEFVPECCCGLLLKKEWEFLGEALAEPVRPYVAISGGAKVSTKLAVLRRLLDKVDVLIIGGAMANTFLLAQGHEVGSSLVERDLTDEALNIVKEAGAKGVTLLLPVDVVVGGSLDDAVTGGIFDAAAIPAGKMVLDVGPKTVDLYTSALATAKTVMWNGPMGAFENQAFAQGSLAIARCLAKLAGVTTIVGGGDTDAVVHKAKLADKFTFISTGGGSFMEFMEGKELPAFKALEGCGK
ncbi:Phosphoglycerate kinase [Desulfovibrio sp. X2]|uniref:phosphoglycerate kinase n=1 Tax=Desulfovibrio sp. X2 TaxID=941449 RepID=UPI0003589BDA|nr:phosphoglycerate kinase [Desulfovibrio sp. X2]EPR42304.1 Phosphoglycerate kinase [Desulfovibrio sp. X2]